MPPVKNSSLTSSCHILKTHAALAVFIHSPMARKCHDGPVADLSVHCLAVSPLRLSTADRHGSMQAAFRSKSACGKQ